MKEDLNEAKEQLNELKEQSFAMELLKDARKTNKRLFIIILVILSMWLATIASFIYYINTTTFEEDYREQTIEDFINVLYEEAEGQQQKQMLSETLQRSMK